MNQCLEYSRSTPQLSSASADALVRGNVVCGRFVPNAVFVIAPTCEAEEAVRDFLRDLELDAAITGDRRG
jgi:hypothetical protein